MKYLKNVFFCSLIVLVISCDSKDDSNNNSFNSADVTAIRDVAGTGMWRVTSFIDDGVDNTDDFEGYTFTFNTDGSLVADNGLETVNGSWSIEFDDDDDESDDLEFDISFSLSNNFDDLSEDWYVLEYNADRIRLSDDDDDDDDDDFLIFERI